MSYVSAALTLSLKAQCRRWQFWGLLLLLLLGACALPPLTQDLTGDAVCVGVVAPETGAEEFCRRLSTRSGSGLRFIPCEESTLIRRVSASQWDCGLLLGEDLDDGLHAGERVEAITLVTGPGTTVAPLIREVVVSVLAEETAPALAGNYLLERGIVSQAEHLSPDLSRPLPESARVHIRGEVFHGERMAPLDLHGDSLRRAVEGTLAVLLLVWSLFTAMDLGRWRDRPEVQRFAPLCSPLTLLLPRLIAALLPVGICAGLALCLALGPQGIWGALSLFPYLCVLGSMALVLSLCRPLQGPLPVLIPLLSAASFLLSPILLDMEPFLPRFAGGLRHLPTALYLTSSAGDPAAAVELFLMTLPGILLAYLLSKRST